MAYGCTPYVGMALKKLAATIKVHKWHAQNVCIRSVKDLDLWKYFQSNGGSLTLLESIPEIPDRQVPKTRISSIFWLLSSFIVSQASKIMAEAIPTFQTQKKTRHKSLGIVLTTYRSQRTRTSRQISGNPTLMLVAIHHFGRLLGGWFIIVGQAWASRLSTLCSFMSWHTNHE